MNTVKSAQNICKPKFLNDQVGHSQSIVQRYAKSPPDGIPILSQDEPVMAAPEGTFDFRSARIASLSCPEPVADPADAGVLKPNVRKPMQRDTSKDIPTGQRY